MSRSGKMIIFCLSIERDFSNQAVFLTYLTNLLQLPIDVL